jgi:effector-binding domain-containing protein
MHTPQSSTEVEVIQLEPQPALIIRDTVAVERLGESVGERIEALSGFVQAHNIQLAGHPFVRYHTFGEIETDFEFGVPVAEPVAGAGRIVAIEMPGGPAATTWHVGAHIKLGEAYARIAQWMKENGREPDSPAWEVYPWIDLSGKGDPSAAASTSEGATRLIQPVR